MTELPSHKTRGVGNDVYGQARLALALRVRDALEHSGVAWFLDAGTLLGAYRNGKLIPHDDDFDMAVYLPTYGGAHELDDLAARLAIDAPYQCRTVTSYAQKLEVFDPNSPRFELPPDYRGADFYAVTVDLQIMTDSAGESLMYLHDLLRHVQAPRSAAIPPGEILCEGHRFQAPRDPTRFLEALYGYLGEDARFDPSTGKYVRA
jgi:hypothetical protein